MKKLLIPFFAFLLAGASIDDARKANEAYRNGSYEKAVELYKKAIDANPENKRLYYNLGNALAKQGNFEEAIRYYEQFKARTDDPVERAKADYNIGNIYTQTKKWDKALTQYKKALRIKEMDNDAKHNYELAKKKKEEQQKQQQQQQQQQQNQNQQQDKQQKDQQQRNNNQNQDQHQNRQEQNQQNQQRKQQQPASQISKAEAEKILNALEQKEKELLKQFKKQKTDSSNTTDEKDW